MSKPYRRERSSAIELRTYPVTMTRAAGGEEGPGKLEGYAAVFNRWTVLVPRDAWYKGSPEFRERIAPGAFKRSIRNSDQRAVWNHNTDFVLGRRKNGTLSLREDEKGLAIQIDPPPTDLVRDMVIAPIERGDVDQMSFAFRTIADEVLEADGTISITLREVDVIEVSPVAIPAYTDTEIALSARSAGRIEDMRTKYAASVEQQDHAEPEESSNPAQHAHAGDPAPVDMRHVDEELRLLLEREMEDIHA